MRFKKNVNIFSKKLIIKKVELSKGLSKKFIIYWAESPVSPSPQIPPEPVMPGEGFLSRFTALQHFDQEFAVRIAAGTVFVSVTRQGFPRAVENMPAATASYTHILECILGRPYQSRIHNACRLRGFHQLPLLPSKAYPSLWAMGWLLSMISGGVFP